MRFQGRSALLPTGLKPPPNATCTMLIAALVATGLAGATPFAASAAESSAVPGAVAHQDQATFTRVVVHVLGVFSLRGFFNMKSRLYQTKGLARYKFDLRDSEMVLDFKPGVNVTPAQVRAIQVEAGYRPGPFKIERLPVAEARDDGPDWFAPPTESSQSAFIRWLQMNF